MKKLLIVLAFALSCVPAFAQVKTPSTSGGGGGGGTGGLVDQGTPAAAGSAWPFKVTFGGTVIDPRDVSDRVARALGKISFDGAQPVTQSGTWTITFPTAANTSAVAVRCVNAAGTAFESCGGGGGGGTLGQQTMANSAPVVIASDQSAVPVSGTFWPATQPVSAASLPLPSGAATSANQVTANTSLSALERTTADLGTNVFDKTVMTGAYNVDDLGSKVIYSANSAPGATVPGLVVRNIPSGTQAVSASSLPLPTGAATSANQTTANTSLSSINSKLPDATERAYSSTISGFADVGGNVAGATLVDVVFSTANFNGTMVYQTSRDGGATYTVQDAIRVYPLSGQVWASNGAATWASGSPVLSEYVIAVPSGVTHARFTTTAYTSGTMAATMVASLKPTPYLGMLMQAEGFATPHAGLLVGGTDGTFFKALPIAGGPAVSEFGSGLYTHVASASNQARTMLQGTSPWVVSASSLPLPTGAATETSAAKAASAVQVVDDAASNTSAMMMASWETTTGGTVRYLRSTNAAPGSSDIGLVTRNIPSGTQTVSGSGTFAVSAASLPLPSGAATAIKQPALGVAGTASPDVLTVQGVASMTPLKVDGSGVTQPVSGTFWQVTQPVSGTVTANVGTTNGLALDATLTGGTQQTKITDGTNVATVKAASTAAVATDKAVVVAVSPNNTVPVSGTFWQVTQPVSGTVTANAGTGTFTMNQSQVNGVTVSTGMGIADTGTQRVTTAQELTYGAGMTAATATAAGTGVFWEMCGSATKTIRVQKILVSGTVATGAKNGDVILTKRSAASTAGTATTLTQFPYDSANAAATAASVKYYTVLATAGASVGVVQNGLLYMPLTGTGTLSVPMEFVWRDGDAEAPTLRGTAQCLSLNFGTTTTNAPSLMVSAKWTEK